MNYQDVIEQHEKRIRMQEKAVENFIEFISFETTEECSQFVKFLKTKNIEICKIYLKGRGCGIINKELNDNVPLRLYTPVNFKKMNVVERREMRIKILKREFEFYKKDFEQQKIII